ncbi:hypothetical protein K504DRAFT_8649 [Pleomassaria siparia CBS 279.74]|uniref:WSC domain-containing protein n=1 Tax=Pleomassaria siparia CBS 279.74 TaxID=1314801 RepID=A0A6G1KQQ1_9PLEO|nr:hypothetical protein K504DRAFT_8649 [Pleomassaria siparia CBS 279.74]
MDPSIRPTPSGLFAILATLLFILPPLSSATSLAFCSSENTSGETQQQWTWQSNGWCNDHCKDDFPYGVVQGNNCWCTAYAPADQVDISECSTACPGFPSEFCGNTDDNLYLYIRLDSNVEPSGTKGTSKPTSSSVSPSSSVTVVTFTSSSTAPASSEVSTPYSAPPSPTSTTPPSSVARPDPETVIQTITAPASVVTYTPSSTLAPSSSALKTSITTPASSKASTDTTPVTSVQVITVSGNIITQTITSFPTSTSGVGVGHQAKSNVGAIVGGVVGGLTILAAVGGAVLFLLFRRRRQKQSDGDDSGVQRNTSTMSKSGLLGSSVEKRPQYPAKIATNLNSRSSRVLDNESNSPASGSDRRNSRLMFDQRLNPTAIMILDNPSRESFASMDDSRDYGRTLNVRNPDPDTR